MNLGSSGRPKEPLYVIPMALALVAAAFAGAAIGFLWQNSDFGREDAVEAAEQQDEAEETAPA
jgi:flagellar basal body-associated protein FliL